MAKKATRRKAQDATLRNVRASQNRDQRLRAEVQALRDRVVEVERQVAGLRRALRSAASLA